MEAFTHLNMFIKSLSQNLSLTAEGFLGSCCETTGSIVEHIVEREQACVASVSVGQKEKNAKMLPTCGIAHARTKNTERKT